MARAPKTPASPTAPTPANAILQTIDRIASNQKRLQTTLSYVTIITAILAVTLIIVSILGFVEIKNIAQFGKLGSATVRTPAPRGTIAVWSHYCFGSRSYCNLREVFFLSAGVTFRKAFPRPLCATKTNFR